MAEQEEIYDSPTGWVAEHIQEYVETDGEKGASLARCAYPAADDTRTEDRYAPANCVDLRAGWGSLCDCGFTRRTLKTSCVVSQPRR